MKKNTIFFNGCFDKNRIKLLISWSLQNCGEHITIDLVESLKNIGFNYATQAGVSLGIDDLKIPPTKAQFIVDSDLQISNAEIDSKKGYITGIEKFQQLIDTWHRTSETLKQNVIEYFKVTNVFNPVYMMAFSGARGNISQVRQLVGMRGLMSDPQGEILDFPIKSNFREGLTLTEYVISCYGARKGLVDTALKTANSGYLTRRLVDVSHHIIVCEFDCKTKKGVILNTIIENQKIIVPLQNRLVGRILAETIYFNVSGFLTQKNKLSVYTSNTVSKNKTSFARQIALFSKIIMVNFFNSPDNLNENKAFKFNFFFYVYQLLLFLNHVSIYYPKKQLIANKNQEVSLGLAIKIASFRKQVLVRSPLTCEIKNSICQLCYGWSLAHGKLVSLGEAVGILAAQSIGEPGTQLTMRTFHTGGVFSGDMMSEIRAPFHGIVRFSESFQGMLIRTPHGKIAFLTKIPGKFEFYANYDSNSISNEKISFQIPAFTILFIRNHEYVTKTQIIAEFSSISNAQNQRVQANHDLNAEIAGEVFFQKIIVNSRIKKGEIISRTTAKLGKIWIIAGQMYTQPIPSAVFPQSGDLVDAMSIIGQYKTLSPYNGVLTTSLQNSPILSTNAGKLSETESKLAIPTDFSLRKQLKLVFQSSPNPWFASEAVSTKLKYWQTSKTSVKLEKNTSFFPFANETLSYKQKKPATKAFSTKWCKDNSKKMKFNTTRIFLHDPLISFPIEYIQYKKIGYFVSFYQSQKNQLNLDRFFFANSFYQKLSNSKKLQTSFSFQCFPKQYQTQTGGIVVYDNFYFNEKLYSGEIFWIGEERYIFHFTDSVYFQNKCDQYTKIINSILFFSKNRKKYSKKSEVSLFTSNPELKTIFGSWNSIPIYNWIQKKICTNYKLVGNFRKWLSKTNPLILNYNNQGKILSIYSKLSGVVETSRIDLFPFPFSSNTVFMDSLSPQGKHNQKQSKQKNIGKHSQTTSSVPLRMNHKNDWKPFSYISKYEFDSIGVKINPIIFVFQLFGFNLSKMKNKFSMKAHFSTSTKKNLNTPKKKSKPWKTRFSEPTFLSEFNLFHYHIVQYFQKNQTLNKNVLKKNSLPFLQPQFPWGEFHQYTLFQSSINTSFSNSIKPLETSFFLSRSGSSSSFNIGGLQSKKQIQNPSKNNSKSIVELYQSSKKKIKHKNKALNKIHFDLSETQLSALDKKKKLIKFTIKQGWVYFPKDIKKAVQKHKLIIKPGEKCFDSIVFDQYSVYIECLGLNKVLNKNKKNIEIPNISTKLKDNLISFFSCKQNFNTTSIQKKNSDLIHLLNGKHIYTEFHVHSNYTNSSLWSTNLKSNFSNFIQNSTFYINFFEILEMIFQNSSSTPFFTKNSVVSLFPFSSTPQNSIFTTRYTLFLLEKYLQKNKLQFLYLLHGDVSTNLVKIYNYKKIYFLENYIFLQNSQQISNSVPLHTSVKKKNFFSLCKPTSEVETKLSIQVDLFQNVLRKKNYTKENSSHSFFFRSTNIFVPQSCILIRKIRSYPVILSSYYKKLLAQQNETTFYSLENQNTSSIPNLNKSLFFNKQKTTPSFFSTPPADFVTKPYFKFTNCKKNIFYKNTTILGFYIVFIIPRNYSFNAATIQLTWKLKLPINTLNLKTINFFLLKQKNTFNGNSSLYLNVLTFRELQFSNSASELLVHPHIQLTRTKLLFYFQNFILTTTPVSLTKFFSPYEGEILKTPHVGGDESALEIESVTKRYLVLTNKDQTSFSIPNSTKNEMVLSKIFVGEFINYGTQIQPHCAIPESGLIIQIEKSKITLRKVQPILFSSKGLLSVHQGDLVEKNALIIRLFYQSLKTGDIVQGIPKIEQLFEARRTNQGELLIGSLHKELRWIFRFYKKKKKYGFQKAAKKSLQKIQQIIVNNVQKVYQSQGVTIAEKHLEIIVRQMTSKVAIITSGQTHLLPGELVDLDWIEMVNKSIKLKKMKVKYKPVIFGITRKSLETKSFISEASFQETTRILARSAIERKTDFLIGLKENVILGHLIPAGTGFAGKVLDPNKPKYLPTKENEYETYTIFRKIFLEITS